MKGVQSKQQSLEQLIFMTLYKLSKLKCSELFLNPVPTDLYPDYLSIIACPMDIETIVNKFKSGKYSYISQIYEDLLLIGKNCFEYNKHQQHGQITKTMGRWIKSMNAGWKTLNKQLSQLGIKEDSKIIIDRQAIDKIGSIEEKLKLAYWKKIEKIKDNGYQNVQKIRIGDQFIQASQISGSSRKAKINCISRIYNNGENIQKQIQAQKSIDCNQNSITNPSPRIGRLTRSKNIQNPNSNSIDSYKQCITNNFDESRSKTRSGSRNNRSFSPNISLTQNKNGKMTKMAKKQKKLLKEIKDIRKEQKSKNRKQQIHRSDIEKDWSQSEDKIQQTILIPKNKKKKQTEKEVSSEYWIGQRDIKRAIQEQPQLISILSSLEDEDKKQQIAAESQRQNTQTIGYRQNTQTIGYRQQTQTYHKKQATQTIQKVQQTFTISKQNHQQGESYERKSQPAEHTKYNLQYQGQNSQPENKQKYSKSNKSVEVINKISIRLQYEQCENNQEQKRSEQKSQNAYTQEHSQPNTEKEQEDHKNLIKYKLHKYKVLLKKCIKWVQKYIINVQPSFNCPDPQHLQYLKTPYPENQQICEQIEYCEQCRKYAKQNQLFKQLKLLKSYQHLQLSIKAQMYNLSKGQVLLQNILTLLKEMNLWVKFVISADGSQNRNNRFNKIYGWRLRGQYEQVQRNIINSLSKIIKYKQVGPEFSVLLQQTIGQIKKSKQGTVYEKRYKNRNANKKNYRRITRSSNKIRKQLLSQPSSISNENSKNNIAYPQKSVQLPKCQNPQTSHNNIQIQENKVEHEQFMKILEKDGVYKGFRVVINQEQCTKYQTLKTLNKSQKKKNKYSANVSKKYNRGSDSSSNSQDQMQNNKQFIQNKSQSQRSYKSKAQTNKKQGSAESQSETENSSEEQDQFFPGTRTKRNNYPRLKPLTKPQRQYLQHKHDQLNKKQQMQLDQMFIAQYSLRSNVCVIQKYGPKLVFDWEEKKRQIFGELPSVISFE